MNDILHKKMNTGTNANYTNATLHMNSKKGNKV